jgi:hypothetical protein
MGSIFHWIAVHYFISFLLFLCLIVLIWGINWNRVFTKNGSKDIPGFLIIGAIVLGIYLYFQLSAIKNWFANPFVGISKWIDENPLTFGIGGLVAIVVGLSLAFWLLRNPNRPKKKSVFEELTSDLAEPIKEEHIFTCPQGVVKYQLSSKSIASYAIDVFAGKKSIESKIRDILETDPDADIKEYEKTLGIKVLSQRKSGKARSKSGYVGWSE